MIIRSHRLPIGTMRPFTYLLLLITVDNKALGFTRSPSRRTFGPTASLRASSPLSASTLEDVAASLQAALEDVEVTKTCKVQMGLSEINRFGLFAKQNIRKGDVMLNMPYDDSYMLTPSVARDVYNKILPDEYDGWTGDAGLIAMLILNEVARLDGKGLALPKREARLQTFMSAWAQALPTLDQMSYHPFLWNEYDLEVLQSSSMTKIYQSLDDVDEDAAWLGERVWGKDRNTFPETVSIGGEIVPCFSPMGFKWAMTLSLSRCIFVDGSLRLLPFLDMANHGDKAREFESGFMGTFGTTKGTQLVAAKDYQKGEEVFCSYGPKSAADYLLEHGFCPDKVWKTCVSELTFELDPDDRFYDDKLDILEFETYESAPMDPLQSFDVVSEPGLDGEPDPALIQFVRLCKLGGTDAFLLESLFRNEVWGFMALPVSESNELAVVNTIIAACQQGLEGFAQCPEGGPEVCTKLRAAESKALTRTKEYLLREKEALDLKEYYQERRLKDLGLDSDWSPEGDMGADLDFGQTRAPGGADYDW